MNSKVRKKMFTTPLTIYPSTETDSAGDIDLLEPFDLLGYVYDSIQVVVNSLGEKEISSRQIYLPDDKIEQVHINDKVTCLDKIQANIIFKDVYRGRYNKVLIGRLYLP